MREAEALQQSIAGQEPGQRIVDVGFRIVVRESS